MSVLNFCNGCLKFVMSALEYVMYVLKFCNVNVVLTLKE